MPLRLPVALDVVRPPSISARWADILLLRYPKPPRIICMVCPHVAIQVLSLGTARIAKFASPTLRVVVDVFAVGNGACQLFYLYFQPSKREWERMDTNSKSHCRS